MAPDSRQRLKTAIYDQFARIGRAISSPGRLELLDLLKQGPRTVEVLARRAEMTIANTSRHLQILRNARLVEREKNGLFVTYRIADQAVSVFLHSMKALAEDRFAQLDWIMRGYLEGKEELEVVGSRALLEKLRAGNVTVIDVRPPEEYRAGHVPGAISIPHEMLPDRMPELPGDKEIVVYCRGRYCVLAREAVEFLRSKGYAATYMEDGIPEWKADDLPVLTGGKEE